MTDKRFRKDHTTFETYYEMLADMGRNGAYARAIQRVVRPGDVVIDLGAGLGFLSFLAARAGAKKVFAIEQSDAVQLGREVAKANGLADVVEFVQMSSTDFTLAERADVIVSETLGSFGVDENTLAFTIDARDRLLRPGGSLVPHGVRLFVAPVHAPERREMSQFWTDVEGIDFTAAIEPSIETMALASIARSQLMAPGEVFAELDLTTIDSPNVEGEVDVLLPKRCSVHGVAGWFEVQLAEGVTLNTSPHHTPTHWTQVIFPLRDRIKAAAGDSIRFSLSAAPHPAFRDEVAIKYAARRLMTGPKPLKSDPCPCGSGEIYKRCCRSV